MSKITRRNFPALAALFTGSLTTPLAAREQADPVFRALDAYAQARADYMIAVDHLEGMKRLSHSAQAEVDQTFLRMRDERDAALATRPTTRAGAAALAAFAIHAAEEFGNENCAADGLRSVWAFLARSDA